MAQLELEKRAAIKVSSQDGPAVLDKGQLISDQLKHMLEDFSQLKLALQGSCLQHGRGRQEQAAASAGIGEHGGHQGQHRQHKGRVGRGHRKDGGRDHCLMIAAAQHVVARWLDALAKAYLRPASGGGGLYPRGRGGRSATRRGCGTAAGGCGGPSPKGPGGPSPSSPIPAAGRAHPPPRW